MPYSGVLSYVAVVKTDVSEESIASTIRVTSIGELEATLAVTNNRKTRRRNRLLVAANDLLSFSIVTLMMVVITSSGTSVLTRATRRNIPLDDILLFLNVTLQSKWSYVNKSCIFFKDL
jgi:hypothetical protein